MYTGIRCQSGCDDTAHTPPSLKRGGKRKKDHSTGGRKSGRNCCIMRKATLKRWINRGYGSEKVEKLIGKIENGFIVLVHVCHSSGC